MDNKQILEELKEQGYINYEKCPAGVDLNNKGTYAELELTDRDKDKITQLIESIPAFVEILSSGAGMISLPEGIFKMPIVLAGGIMSSAMLGQVAALGGANVLGAFSILAIFTGQFFLLSITKEFKQINQKLDEILEFLRNEKESNLLSEANFIKYACDNYSLIMPNETQRVATIANIQQTKKVAMKDIEFYLRGFKENVRRLDGQKTRDLHSVTSAIDAAEQIEKNLDFALQLYIMSNLMEVCYAQNYERKYIENLKNYVMEYIENCKENIVRSYGNLETYLEKHKQAKDKNKYEEYQERISKSIVSLRSKHEDMCNKAYEVLEKSTQETKYYIKKEGGKYHIYCENHKK